MATKTNGKGRKPGNLEGTLYQREDGNRLWVAQILIAGKRKSKSFKTYREGKEWLREMQEVKTELGGNGIKLVTFLSEWIERRNPLNSVQDDRTEYEKARDETDGVVPWKETTYLTNLSIMNLHIIPYIDPNLLITAVDREWVAEFFTQAKTRMYIDRKTKLEKKVGSRTRQVMRNLLHSAFENAVARKIVRKTPVENIHVKYSADEREILTREEFHKLCNVALKTWYRNLITLSVALQLRRGEILGLIWDNVDWENREVRIVQQLQRLPVEDKKKVREIGFGTTVGSSLVLSTLKTGKSKRTVKLGKRSMKLLRDQWELIEKKRTVSGWVDHGFVFPNQQGGPMELHTLRRAFKALMKEAGLKTSFRFHDMRHTGLSYIQSKQVGGSRKSAKERAGHADEKTTGKYTHTVTDDQEIVAERLDDFLFGEEDEDGDGAGE